MNHNPRECWCGIDHSFEYPTERVDATTTPEGAKGWVDQAGSAQVLAGGHGLDVAPDAQPEGVRAETRRENDGDRGEPSNAPTAASEWHLHVGRSWVGHPLEDDCPCGKAACGLVDSERIDPACPQHTFDAAKTFRQVHLAAECPS